MKTSFKRLLLIALLVVLMAQGSPEVRRSEAQLLQAALLVACMAVAGCVVVKVMSKNSGYRIHRLVLQRSPTLDGQNWSSITTNDFNLEDGQWFSAWGLRMQQGQGYSGEMYRVVEIPIPPGGFRAETVHTNIVWIE